MITFDSGSFTLSIEVFYNDVVIIIIYFCVKLSGGVSIRFTVLIPQTWLVIEGHWVYFSLITLM